MTKLKKMLALCALTMSLISLTPVVSQPVVCQAASYEDVKSKVSDFTDGAKRFWNDSKADREKLTRKAKKKWQKLQKKIKKEYKKAKKKGKKGLKKFKKWRKKQEKEFWAWYKAQMNKK